MELLTKIVKTLPDKQFYTLLEKVGGMQGGNSHTLLTRLRIDKPDDEKLQEEMGMTRGAFNTFKSRLLKKVSNQLSKLDENTISLLKEETARLSQLVMQNERDISIRLLQEMEKRLIEYDLSSELSVIYKNLARLHRFQSEYDEYERLYKKHVAFSLTVTKAEDLLYDFIFYLSHYHLQKDEETLLKIQEHLSELETTCQLYESHRLHVLYNIAKIYYHCSFLAPEHLAQLEIEVEETLQGFQEIFDKYEQDAFYQNIKYLVPFLFFEFYAKVGNMVKANYYLQKINYIIERVTHLQLWPFFITQMINSIVSKYIKEGDRQLVFMLEDKLYQYYYPKPEEVPHFICYYRFLAMVSFYKGLYPRAAKTINNLRNTVTLKEYPLIETEMKLFQAFQYALQNDVELVERLLASTKRQNINDHELKPLVKQFGKVLTLILKHRQDGGEKEQIIKYWNRFKNMNNNKMLPFVRLSLIHL